MMNRTKTPQRRVSLFLALISFVFILFFTLPEKTAAQKFKKLENGVADTVIASCTEANYLYVVYRSKYFLPDSVIYQVARWDGNNWFYYPQYKLDKSSISFGESSQFNAYIKHLRVFNGQIYMAGKLQEKVSQTPFFMLRLNNNNKWDTILIPNKLSPLKGMEIFKDRLYLISENLVCNWDGTNWTTIQNSQSQPLVNGYINSVLSTQNYLYIGGSFNMVDSVKTNKIAKWDGNKWSAEDIGFSDIRDLSFFKNQLYAFGTDQVWKKSVAVKDNIAGWKVISDSTKISGFEGFLSSVNHKDSTLNFWLLKFADNNKILCTLLSWNGSKWSTSHFKDTFHLNYSKWGYGNPFMKIHSFKNNLIVSGGFTRINYDTVNFITQLSLNNSTNLSGYAFLEMNDNCIKDSFENNIAGHLIRIMPGSYYIAIDSEGNYEYSLDPGNYTLTLLPKKYHINTCSAEVKLNALADSNYNDINFSMKPIPDITDIKVNLIGALGFRARLGFTESYKIIYENIGTTEIDSGSINLVNSNILLNLESSTSYDSVAPNNLKWDFKNLKPGEKRSINFNAKIDLQAKLNEAFKLYTFTDNYVTLADTNKIDNADTLKQIVVGAIDPNDKQVSPEAKINPGTKELSYHIRFQNTGNDTAYTVVIKDPLDSSIKIEEIEIINASHPYNYAIVKGFLAVTFNNILLPDSNTNEPLSHGYFAYKVKLKENLPPGTEIRNTAYIYFDFQPAVITNTTINTIRLESSVQETTQIAVANLKVYPNPSTTSFNIENTSAEVQNLRMINMLGQMVSEIKLNSFETLAIDVSLLPEGLYLIKSDKKENSTVKVIIQH